MVKAYVVNTLQLYRSTLFSLQHFCLACGMYEASAGDRNHSCNRPDVCMYCAKHIRCDSYTHMLLCGGRAANDESASFAKCRVCPERIQKKLSRKSMSKIRNEHESNHRCRPFRQPSNDSQSEGNGQIHSSNKSPSCRNMNRETVKTTK